MGSTLIFTQEMDDQIRSLRAQGLAWFLIASDMNLDESTVSRRAKFLGLTAHKKPRVPEQPHHAEQVRQMHAAGMTKTAIVAETGLSMDRVGIISRRLGLMPARKPVVAKEEGRSFDGRGGYRAGHPVTWGLITAGTCLEGEPYPCP